MNDEESISGVNIVLISETILIDCRKFLPHILIYAAKSMYIYF